MSDRVVVAAALVRDGALLAAHRPAGSSGPGWELPGGKVEPGEDEREALVRELREELGVEVVVGTRVGGEWPLPGVGVLRVWWCHLEPPTTEPRALDDHDAVLWVRPERFPEIGWLPVDSDVVAAIGRLLG